MSAENATPVFVTDARRGAVLRGVFDSFYADVQGAALYASHSDDKQNP